MNLIDFKYYYVIILEVYIFPRWRRRQGLICEKARSVVRFSPPGWLLWDRKTENKTAIHIYGVETHTADGR